MMGSSDLPATTGSMSAPLKGVRVAVTRSVEQAGDLAESLRSLGAEVYECPAIRIAPVESYGDLDAAVSRLYSYDWVIFTSANGVAAFADRMRAVGVDAGRLKERRIAAIGPATAQALAAMGCPPDFVPRTYVAEAIVEQIGAVAGLKVLLPRADIAREALAVGLRARGAEVDEITAYRTVPAEGTGRLADLLSLDRVDAVTFTSSSTVRYTLEGLEAVGLSREAALGLLNATKVVCIGPITEGTARELGLSVAAVAEDFTSRGLVDALVRLYAQRGKEDA